MLRTRTTRRQPRLALLLGLLLSGSSGCISIELPGKPGPLVETELDGEGDAKIVLVEIEGVLTEAVEPESFGLVQRESVVARVRAQLDAAREDDAVRAVVLRIHSPGGTVGASEMLYGEIRRFKARSGLPVVAELMGVATSGAYYTAMAADAVLAHPTTVTGSIGVVFVGVNLAGLMEKLGIEDQTFTAGDFKDAGSPLRAMRPEERAQIQSVLDDLHQRFKRVVAEGRPELDAQRVAELADGRIYSATQAMRVGLVDGIADLPGAIAEARRRAGVEQARVVTYHRRREWRENLYTSTPDLPLRMAIGLSPRPSGPRFLYLWQPGAY